MRPSEIAKTALYIALTLMAMAFGLTALVLGKAVAHSIGLGDAVLLELNRPCGGPPGHAQPCGTLADVAKTLNTIRGTAGQAELAARHENAQLGKLDAQEAQLYRDLHATLQNAQTLTASLNGTARQATADLATVNRTADSLNAALAGIPPIEAQSARVLGHVDALAADPDLQRILAASASTAAHVDGTAADVQAVADNVTGRFLHPPPKHWWNYAGKVWLLAWQSAMLAR